MTTFTEQLASVREAIGRIEEGAQSYTISTPTGSRSGTRGDLETLYARERWLLKMIDRETRGGIRVRGATPV